MATDTKQASRRDVAERLLDHLDALLLRTVKLAAIEEVLSEHDERAAKIADGVENEWLTNARNVARTDDLVGGLTQSTYTSYAEVANKIAAAIRNDDHQ